MAIAALAKISPMNIGTGSRVDIYVSSRDDRNMTGLNGQVWEPAMVQAPQLGISLWNGDFTQAVDVARAIIPLNMETVQKTWPGSDAYYWVGAPVTVYAEEPGTAWPWTTRFIGKVSGFSRRSQVLSLTAEADPEPLAKNVLGTLYAGTGGPEGATDLANRPKPLILGWAQNVEPILIDAVNSIYQFSGYGPVEAISKLYERGSDFGAAAGDYPTYLDLVAATVAPGSWVSCVGQGMIRLGAPAYGVITGDVKGHKIGSTTPRLPGSVINGLLTVAGISTSYVNLTSLAALDSAVPYNINVVVNDQTSFVDLARKIALSCNYQAGVSLLGQFFVTQITLSGTAAITLHAQGQRWPQVVVSDEVDVSPPYYRTILGANRSWRVHSAEEVALATTAEETAVEALLTAQLKGKVTLYPAAMPSLADSAVGDTYVTQDGTFLERVNEGGILLGGFRLTLAGDAPHIGWTKSAVQPSQLADWEKVYGSGKPETGADVTSLILGPADLSVIADYTGAITAALPKIQSYQLSRNGSDVTTGATWSVTVLTGTMQASIGTATGVLSIDKAGSILTSGTVRIVAAYGSTTRAVDVRITVDRSAVPTANGGTASGTIGGTTASTAMVAVGSELSVTVGASGNVSLNADYSFDMGSGETSALEYARWYRWNGAAYVAIGTEVAATSPAGFQFYGDFSATYCPGAGACGLTDTGLTPASTQKYQLFMRNDSGTYSRAVTGTCSAVSS